MKLPSSARLRLGTRRSALARTQSQQVAERVEAAAAQAARDVAVELVDVTTQGDVSSAPLASMGGTGVFVTALREAVLAGEVDVAVHSLKDLPTAPAPGLVVAAVPPREDPRDVVVTRTGCTLAELPAGARIGTGSPRRAAQLRSLGLGLEVVDLRGNVDTRLRAVAEGALDAVVLARAGLLRLGRADEAGEVLDPLLMLPAPGQGALAVECRAGDDAVLSLLTGLDDGPSRLAVTAERAVLARLEAGCSAPLGALAECVEGEDGPELFVRAVVVSLDGTSSLRRSLTRPLPGAAGDGDLAAAEAAGAALAEQLLEDGAAALVRDGHAAAPGVAHLTPQGAPSAYAPREGDL